MTVPIPHTRVKSWNPFSRPPCFTVWLVIQIAKTLRSPSLRHWPDTFMSDQCQIDIDLTVFAIWDNVITTKQSTTKPCVYCMKFPVHYNDVVMGAIVSQITSLAIVYSAVYSGADQRKHQSSASLAFVRGIHRGPVNFPHKWPVARKMFPFDDVIMTIHLVNTTMACRHGVSHMNMEYEKKKTDKITKIVVFIDETKYLTTLFITYIP